jgi:hypothetical protein
MKEKLLKEWRSATKTFTFAILDVYIIKSQVDLQAN